MINQQHYYDYTYQRIYQNSEGKSYRLHLSLAGLADACEVALSVQSLGAEEEPFEFNALTLPAVAEALWFDQEGHIECDYSLALQAFLALQEQLSDDRTVGQIVDEATEHADEIN